MVTMAEWQVNVCCLAATDVAWEKKAVRKAVRKTSNKRYGRSSALITSTSSIKSGSNVKYGGTGIIVDNNWSSRLADKGQDPKGMGRWSFVRLLGKDGKTYLLITAYRVGKMDLKMQG